MGDIDKTKKLFFTYFFSKIAILNGNTEGRRGKALPTTNINFGRMMGSTKRLCHLLAKIVHSMWYQRVSFVPCKMMKPIFDELTKEYKGKANILLIEIYDYRSLAAQYRVRAIPTQIFFDRDGKEVWRHEGFLPKENIVKKLKELGA